MMNQHFLILLLSSTQFVFFQLACSLRLPTRFTQRRGQLVTWDIPVRVDRFSASSFHHIEFYCFDATTTYKRFCAGLGLNVIGKSDQSTGNTIHASYAVRSNNMTMVFTAPYGSTNGISDDEPTSPFPKFSSNSATDFVVKHGLGVHAVAVNVDDAEEAYRYIVNNGGKGLLPPSIVEDSDRMLGYIRIAEVELYGDAVLRLIERTHYSGVFLPRFTEVERESVKTGDDFGFLRFDHIVGNLWSLEPQLSLIRNMTGFHEFAEFTAEDVGTVDSGLNSVVLASDNEFVLLPLNEPTYGTKRKSQIQTYLEQNKGEGVQHLAMFTTDIFRTVTKMRGMSARGGFDFVSAQSSSYYQNLRTRLGSSLSESQYQQLEQLGILADKDGEGGVLLQIFTKPVGDRMTVFLEVIQRIGCRNFTPSSDLVEEGNYGTESSEDSSGGVLDWSKKPGCGGFGKGNFRDLFRSIEDYEKTLNI